MQVTRKKEAPRLPRPAGRYWKGKAPKGAEDIADGFDSDIEEDGTVETDDIFLQDDFQLNTEDSHLKTATNQKAINITLKSTDIIQEEVKKGTDQATGMLLLLRIFFHVLKGLFKPLLLTVYHLKTKKRQKKKEEERKGKHM